jgi:sec-independent protein translocase protein TatA
MFSQIGPMEIVLVLVVALLILGPKRLPEAGRSLGRGLREFKDSITEATSDEPTELEKPKAAQPTQRETTTG